MKKCKSNIIVFIEIFNEIGRIESCLKNFIWADELIVIDKNSTDGTYEIAVKYATKVIRVPFSENSDEALKIIAEYKTEAEWALFPTASSLIHPELVSEIIKLTTSIKFKYEVISLPYSFYAFGIESSDSPWGVKYKNILIKRSNLKLSNVVHNEIGFKKKSIFTIKNRRFKLLHCTHSSVGDFLEKVNRYGKRDAADEVKNLGYSRAINTSIKSLFKSIFLVLIVKRTIFYGRDGISLSLAYILYFMIKFIYVWDSKNKIEDDRYKVIKDKYNALWENLHEK